MIEAINSTITSASLLQRPAAQVSSVKAPVTSNTKVEEAAPKAEGFYLSRNVRVDNTSKVAVLEFRNPLNGDVKTQIPTESQLRAYAIADIQADAEAKADTAA